MTEQHPDRETLDTAKGLTQALDTMAAEVKRLGTYGRRNRKFIVFDILLTLALTAVGASSVHAVQSADNARAGQAALCEAGNISRAQQVQLWDYLLTLTAPAKGAPPQTPEQKARVAAFRAFLAKDFAPRDCDALVNGNP